ncbi:MAG: glycosyltransferase [Verrucomicrobia bacterium]|nr:glycosyltransferase [Verrucomicrobiota bacterium]
MKIFHINSTSHGSTGTIARQIISACEAAGHTGYFAHGLGKIFSEREYVLSSVWRTRWHNLCSRITDRQCFFSKKDTLRLIDLIRAANPDIIHLHNLHGHYLHIGVLFEFLKTFPGRVVWTLHDCWLFTGHCAYFDFLKCEKWRNGCEKCPGLTRYPPSFIADASKRNWRDKRELFSSVEKLILCPVSDWLGVLVKGSFLKNKRVCRIHNGVDVEIFQPVDATEKIRKNYSLGAQLMVLGCASGWEERKGLPDFIKLRERFSEGDLAIVLVGLTEKQIKELPAGIVGIRRTGSAEELAELYSAADLFVNPTYEDNFPTVNIEALACGTPVCTYRTGGSPEAVDSVTGFVVEQGDIDGIVSAIETVRSRGKAAYSAACRSRVLNCFRKEDRYAEYVSLYEKLARELH